MTTKLKSYELREHNPEDLVHKLAEAKEEFFNLRFQNATGQLENYGQLQRVKRNIARIETIIRERDLGIEITTDTAPAESSGTSEKSEKKARRWRARKAEDMPGETALAETDDELPGDGLEGEGKTDD